MHYTVARLRDVRMVAVLVDKGCLDGPNAESFIVEMQQRFALPAMLVAQDTESIPGMRARAQFDAVPYLFSLLAIEDVEWQELGPAPEPDLPF